MSASISSALRATNSHAGRGHLPRVNVPATLARIDESSHNIGRLFQGWLAEPPGRTAGRHHEQILRRAQRCEFLIRAAAAMHNVGFADRRPIAPEHPG